MKYLYSLFLMLCVGGIAVLGLLKIEVSYAQTPIQKPTSVSINIAQKISIDNLNTKIIELQQKIEGLSHDNQFLQIELLHQQQIATDWKNHYDVLAYNESLFYPARLFYWISRWSVTPFTQINFEGVPLLFIVGVNGTLLVVFLVILILVKFIGLHRSSTSINLEKAYGADSDSMLTKLDLARAYIDMKEYNSAREILKEVVEKGDNHQQKEAKRLIDSCR